MNGQRETRGNKIKVTSLETVRWHLAIVWFCGAGIIFLLLAVQSLSGLYQDRLQGVWGWALPNFLPTLSFMLAVFGASALQHDTEDDHIEVRTGFYRLSLALSIFYLCMLLLTILIQPFATAWRNETSSGQSLETANLWLGPLQGLVVAALSVLFFLRQKVSLADLERK